MNVRFVLVEPQRAGNVGAAARAMKNLGFTRLALVAPRCDPSGDEARRLAVDAEDLLRAARIHASLDAALEGAATVVGATGVAGKQRRPHYRLDAIAPQLARLARAAETAVVFGREDHGLTDDELDRCTHLVRLPSSQAYPSFNLAQAVLLVAYEIFRAELPDDERPLAPPARHEEREAMYAHLAEALLAVGFLHDDTATGMMRRIRRVLGRASLTAGDAKIVRGIARQILWLARSRGATER